VALLAALIALLWWQGRHAGIEGQALEVFDGDSFLMQTMDGPADIRIFGVDSPERGQGWNRRARQSLAALLADEALELVVVDIDRYGRTVARVIRVRDGLDVGAEQVRQGNSWVYRAYTRDPDLLALEAEARVARRGLWSLPEHERMAPWEWRRENRARRAGEAGS
jgi:endonuclease YncB( thermonuclease family)